MNAATCVRGLAILLVVAILTENAQCDVTEDFKKVLTDVKEIEKAGGKSIRVMGNQVNSQRSANGNYYWRETTLKFKELNERITAERNAFFTTIKSAFNASAEENIKVCCSQPTHDFVRY